MKIAVGTFHLCLYLFTYLCLSNYLSLSLHRCFPLFHPSFLSLSNTQYLSLSLSVSLSTSLSLSLPLSTALLSLTLVHFPLSVYYYSAPLSSQALAIFKYSNRFILVALLFNESHSGRVHKRFLAVKI